MVRVESRGDKGQGQLLWCLYVTFTRLDHLP